MLNLWQAELTAALNAVRQATVVCRSVQSAISTESLDKKDKSPVTVADFASQAMICRTLQSAFPDDPVIGEEGAEELRAESGSVFLQRVVRECQQAGMAASATEICDWIDRGNLAEYRERFWTLDPIDGTKGFLRREQYAISLALIVEGTIEVGILGCPNMPVDPNAPDAGAGVLAWAVRGGGSWMQPLDHPEITPVRIRGSSVAVSADARFCESVESGHSSHDWSGLIARELNIRRDPIRMDSQCKYLAVARGEAELYLRLPTRKGYREKIWDHAGGVILVEEAGGTVTDVRGKPVNFRRGATLADNEGMIVSNGCFHPQIVAAVLAHAPADFSS